MLDRGERQRLARLEGDPPEVDLAKLGQQRLDQVARAHRDAAGGDQHVGDGEGLAHRPLQRASSSRRARTRRPRRRPRGRRRSARSGCCRARTRPAAPPPARPPRRRSPARRRAARVDLDPGLPDRRQHPDLGRPDPLAGRQGDRRSRSRPSTDAGRRSITARSFAGKTIGWWRPRRASRRPAG